jgi:hypothetical protein
MFTSMNPSPQPSPRLGGERELFPFGVCVGCARSRLLSATLTCNFYGKQNARDADA